MKFFPKFCFHRKIEQYTKEFLKEESNSNDIDDQNILRDSVIIGFTPKEIERRALSSLLDDNEESMWNKLLNVQKHKHM